MSQEQPHTMVVGNGGLYSIMEVNETLGRWADLLLLKDSGRFAQATAAVVESGVVVTEENIYDVLQAALPDDVLTEFLQKDFGQAKTPKSDDYLVYREFFFYFIALARQHKDRVMVSTIANLEHDLDQSIIRQKKDRRPA